MNPLKQKFLDFHNENPWVYQRILEICRQLRQRGFTFYSSRTLIAVMRFEWDLKTSGEDVQVRGEVEPRTVKLNDHHTPYYARMLMKNHPEFAGFFELRELDGDDDDLYPLPPPGTVMTSPPPPPPPLGPQYRQLLTDMVTGFAGKGRKDISDRILQRLREIENPVVNSP